MIRKIVTALVLVPLTVAFIAFAVANRQSVVISFDPFDPQQPALAVAVPMFALALGLVIAGVILGGVSAWLKQSKWRRAARLAEAEARELRAELAHLKRRSRVAEPQAGPVAADYSPRLTLPPPAA
jgi:hypothetical protein